MSRVLDHDSGDGREGPRDKVCDAIGLTAHHHWEQKLVDVVAIVLDASCINSNQ